MQQSLFWRITGRKQFGVAKTGETNRSAGAVISSLLEGLALLQLR